MPGDIIEGGGGEKIKKGEEAREAYLAAIKKYNCPISSEKDYKVENAFGELMALLEGKNSLLLQDLFYNKNDFSSDKDWEVGLLKQVIYDLQQALGKVEKKVEDSSVRSVFSERVEAVKDIIKALEMLCE
ncbi:MAG: hypothetical protein HY569_01075 [Candidatus Magasanikbacteria bacterium]|nr:hypothetical protein [Candidatus Magasanikbacteria bacterium]